MRRLAGALALALAAGGLSAASLATLSIDAGNVLRSVSRGAQVGVNLDLWKDLSKIQAYQGQLAAAGVRRFRYPGGALADAFHWNSNGSYGADGLWRPSATAFTAPGFRADLRHRGTTDRGSSVGSFASKLTDNDFSSEWRSNTLSAHGIDPWFYVDLGSSVNVNKLTLTWGSPYATDYKIQAYSGASGAPYQDAAFNWTTLLTVSGGMGGTDTRTFASTSTRFVRVELTASSGAGFAVKEAQAYFNLTLRSAHSPSPSAQSLCVAAPTANANDASATPAYLGFEDFMSFINAYPGGAEPVITVNLGTGTPEEAAAWVHYANVVRGYGIKHWELGNEVEGVQMPGGPYNGFFYAERLKAFSAAMRAEDPSILLEGPVLAWLEAPSQIYDGTSWTSAFFNRLQSTASLGALDILNFHDYPNWPNNNPSTSLATYRNWKNSKNAYIQAINTAYYPGSSRPVHLSEANSGDATSFTVKLTNGLWLASYFAEFLKAWGDTGASSYWFMAGDMYQAGDGTWGDHGMLEGRNNAAIPAAARGQGRADYWAAWLLKTKWMTSGVSLQMVSATSSALDLPAWAMKRGDGHLTVLVVNLDPATTYSGSLTVNGFAPAAGGLITTYAGASDGGYYNQDYGWLESGYNSYATTDLTPTTQAYGAYAPSFSHSFPPYSITVFDMADSLSTFTSTPQVSPSATPTPVTALVFDDFESNQTVQAWQSYAWGGAAVSAMALNAGCAEEGGLGASVTLSTGPNGGGGLIFGSPYGPEPLDGGWLPHRQYRDLSGALTLEAWVKCSSTNVELKLVAVESALNGGEGEQFTANNNVGVYAAAAGVWQKLSLPLSGFVRTSGAGDNLLDLQAVKETQLSFWGMNQSSVSLCVDPIRYVLILPATATTTATPSASATRTRSATATPSPTPTPTRTATTSTTPSQTQTSTPTPTRTGTPSASATASGTGTRTASATGTGSPSPSATAEPSPTASWTRTGTSTVSSSRTATATSTPSPTLTPSMTLSATATASNSATASPSQTLSPSSSPTFTDVPPGSTETDTPAPSATASATPSFSSTGTGTPSQTRTSTPTPSATASATPSFSSTGTGTPSQTRTSTPTPSATASATPAGTASQTATPSPSASSSRTSTPTASASGTTFPSPTPSLTPSATGTGSPSPSATAEPSPTWTDVPAGSTPTNTATQSTTRSVTPTVTGSATPSSASTGTGTPSQTQTSTPTASSTPSSSATATASVTVSFTPSASISASPSVSTTSVVAVTFTCTGTSSSTAVLPATPSSTVTPALASATPPGPAPSGAPQILAAVFAPQPVQSLRATLACRLSQPADRLWLSFYSRDMKLCQEAVLTRLFSNGWNAIQLDLPELANGVFFVQARAARGPEIGSLSKPFTVFLLR